MKQQSNPLHQLQLRQKLIIAFIIPIIMTLTVTMLAVMGYKQIGAKCQIIQEKVKHQEEILEMLEHFEKRIQMIQTQLIMVTIISIILLILLAFIISRSIPAQQSGSGFPEAARNELLAMRQKIDEILSKYL